MKCRIMRDLSRIGASGSGKSRGYAFVSFTEHSDALRALKATNNQPEIFGDKKVWLTIVNVCSALILVSHCQEGPH